MSDPDGRYNKICIREIPDGRPRTIASVYAEPGMDMDGSTLP